jgi:hypothetical protein
MACILGPLLIWPRLGGSSRWAYAAVLAVILLLAGAASGTIIRQNLESPRDWDFRVFWLAARAAAEGRNPYAPADLAALSAAREASSTFQEEVVARGIPYPPPTVALFRPLGSLELGTALRTWYALHVILLGVVIGLMGRLFFAEFGAWGLAACAALVLLFRPVGLTFFYAQTHFALLLALLLYARKRDGWAGGACLAAGTIVKPMLAAFLLYPLLRAHGRVFAGFALAMALFWVGAVALLGPTVVTSYFVDSPLEKRPAELLAQPVNQSLLAVMLRVVKPDLGGRPPYFHPLFLAAAAALLAVTAWLVWRNRRAMGHLELGLLVPFALLVYPPALHHYAALLLLPWMAIWKARGVFGGGWAALLLSGVFVLVCTGGNGVFLAVAFTWVTAAAWSWRGAAEPVDGRAAPAAATG